MSKELDSAVHSVGAVMERELEIPHCSSLWIIFFVWIFFVCSVQGQKPCIICSQAVSSRGDSFVLVLAGFNAFVPLQCWLQHHPSCSVDCATQQILLGCSNPQHPCPPTGVADGSFCCVGSSVERAVSWDSKHWSKQHNNQWTGLSTDWLANWLTGWLAEQLLQLTKWLTDWPSDQLTN